MTNPSPTLARIQKKVAKSRKWVYTEALESAITDQDRQLAERDEEIARLREQLAEADEAVLGTCDPAQWDKAYDAALARQEQRRKERE